jgi:glutathione S-transferase
VGRLDRYGMDARIKSGHDDGGSGSAEAESSLDPAPAFQDSSEKTMKLYYFPGTCAMASHIVLNELGADAEFVQVDRQSRRTPDGTDYHSISPNGYVPALQLDGGEVLLENAAILPYIGDLRPDAGWMPASGLPRYRVLEWLGFVNTELHGNYKPLFSGLDGVRDYYLERLATRYAKVEKALGKGDFLTGERPSVADAYLYVVSRWADHVGFDLSPYPALQSFMRRMGERPAVRKTLAEEGFDA